MILLLLTVTHLGCLVLGMLLIQWAPPPRERPPRVHDVTPRCTVRTSRVELIDGEARGW